MRELRLAGPFLFGSTLGGPSQTFGSELGGRIVAFGKSEQWIFNGSKSFIGGSVQILWKIVCMQSRWERRSCASP